MARLLTRFARAVRVAPDRPAVRSGDRTLTFAELDRRSAVLAAGLVGRGVRRGDLVGVCLPRGVDLMVALLGVWRSGAAYVPLDPAYPAARLAAMAQAARLTAVVHDGPVPDWAGCAVVVPPDGDGGGDGGDGGVDGDPGAAFSDDTVEGPAYAIFTSGSSGPPKGVLVTHANVAALVTALETAGVYGERLGVVAWNASVSFDASVKQWVRVCRGDTVVVLDDLDRFDPERLRALLDRHAVTDLDLTPTHWEILREELLPPAADGRVLRLLMGGEAVPERTWREIAAAPGLEGINVYGPTECTVDATAARMAGERPNLGTALPGVRLSILGGDVGELCIAGPQVALGYLGAPGLTASKFVPEPGGEGTRRYRTGDLVRRLPDGEYEYLGRADRQVKWRGVRIELGEIEDRLRECAGVASAAVTVSGERLLAHVVPTVPAASDDRVPTPRDLARHLADRLPETMLPSKIVLVDALPVTVNGKLDLAALAH
ncbi:amino acid adenylation domain-containing protein [Catenulispora subtropica]|uniref:Amino acid adenylation domain protein n=1 Tax=Catenulispora subtropica TaxID=450798 RepID=A0ABN2TD09_9ACTN